MNNFIKKLGIGFANMMVGVGIGGYWMGRKYCLKLINSRNLVDKHLNMVRLYDIWMMTKQNGASIAQYLSSNNIHSIAIYGMSYMGIRLFHELMDSSVRVEYGIDREPKMRIPGLKIFHPEELDKIEVDAVIVTAVFSFDVIKKNLENLRAERVIALDEILYDLI